MYRIRSNTLQGHTTHVQPVKYTCQSLIY